MAVTQQANVHPASKEQRINNPYLVKLNQSVDDIMRMDVAGIQPEKSKMAHIKPDNDWIYGKLAGMTLALAYAWNSPQAAVFHQKAVWLQMEKFLNRVLDNCKNGKWWREQPGTGAPILTVLPCCPLWKCL